MEAQSGVGHLKKIRLLLEAGSSADCMDFTREPVPFEFIFGIGPGGMTPFEYVLAEKREGESFSLWVDREEAADFFEHISLPSLGVPPEAKRFYLRGKVAEVTPADQRELIAAMAEIAGCGDHCCGH